MQCQGGFVPFFFTAGYLTRKPYKVPRTTADCSPLWKHTSSPQTLRRWAVTIRDLNPHQLPARLHVYPGGALASAGQHPHPTHQRRPVKPDQAGESVQPRARQAGSRPGRPLPGSRSEQRRARQTSGRSAPRPRPRRPPDPRSGHGSRPAGPGPEPDPPTPTLARLRRLVLRPSGVSAMPVVSAPGAGAAPAAGGSDRPPGGEARGGSFLRGVRSAAPPLSAEEPRAPAAAGGGTGASDPPSPLAAASAAFFPPDSIAPAAPRRAAPHKGGRPRAAGAASWRHLRAAACARTGALVPAAAARAQTAPRSAHRPLHPPPLWPRPRGFQPEQLRPGRREGAARCRAAQPARQPQLWDRPRAALRGRAGPHRWRPREPRLGLAAGGCRLHRAYRRNGCLEFTNRYFYLRPGLAELIIGSVSCRPPRQLHQITSGSWITSVHFHGNRPLYLCTHLFPFPCLHI